jgi:hypothetical protein
VLLKSTNFAWNFSGYGTRLRKHKKIFNSHYCALFIASFVCVDNEHIHQSGTWNNWLLVTVMGWYRTKRHMHCGLFWSVMCPHLCSDHSWFIQPCPLVAAETSSSESGSLRVISFNLADVVSLHAKQGPLTCRKILRPGTDRFTSPPKKGVLQICIAVKNPSPPLGLNPRILGIIVSTLTITPPRRLTWKITMIAFRKSTYSTGVRYSLPPVSCWMWTGLPWWRVAQFKLAIVT